MVFSTNKKAFEKKYLPGESFLKVKFTHKQNNP